MLLAPRSEPPKHPAPSRFGISGGPLLRRLDKLFPIVLVLFRDGRVNGIVGHRLDHQLSDVFQRRGHPRTGLPFTIPQESETHGTLPIVGDVRVVDLRLPVDHRWFEGVLVGEYDVD